MSQLHNALDRATDLVRGFRRALGLTGPGGVERLGETLTPTFDLWARHEHRLLRGERLGGGWAAMGAPGAFFNMAQIWLPAGTRVLVVPLYMVASGAARAFRTSTSFTTPEQTVPLDCRLEESSVGRNLMARVRSDIQAGPVGTEFLKTVVANTYIVPPIVITPGNGLALCTDVVNTAMNFSFAWYEAPLLPGEQVLA